MVNVASALFREQSHGDLTCLSSLGGIHRYCWILTLGVVQGTRLLLVVLSRFSEVRLIVVRLSDASMMVTTARL
jgi:hypothetical protein